MQAESIVSVLKNVLPEEGGPFPLHEPLFAGNEWDYVKECIDTGWVSSVGSYVDKFEEMLAAACGVKHAVVTVNGTAAIHVILHMLGVGQGEEVIVPSLTFVATANAVTYCGAVPHFADIDEGTLGIDPAALGEYLERIGEKKDGGLYNKETGRRIAAIIPVHVFGHPVDMDALLEVAGRYDIPVIEDAAEALGSFYKGRKAGSLARMAAMSFNGNKIVTTGGGGAILTDDDALAKRAKHLSTTAKLAHQWAYDHDEIGFNYRMPNINAALGCAQLGQLDGFIKAKRQLSVNYEQAFEGLNSVTFFKEPEFAESNYWLNAVLLDDVDADGRDDVLAALHGAGFLCRPAWKLMHHLPFYKNNPRMDMTVSENIERRLINLPSSVRLGQGL